MNTKNKDLVELKEKPLVVIKYSLDVKAAKKIKEKSLALTITGVDDKAGYALIHSARMDAKNKRVALEKERKLTKGKIIEAGELVDSKASEIKSFLIEAENHLKSQEKIIDDEKARISKEKTEAKQKIIDERMGKLYAVNTTHSVSVVSAMTDEDFQTELEKATIIFEEAQAKEKAEKEKLEQQRLEQEKIAKEQAEKEAALLAEREAIAKQQRLEQEKIDSEKAEIKAEQEQIAREKAAEAVKKQRFEDIEKAKKEAIIEAEKEAKRKELEAAEKVRLEKEKLIREEKLRPDKEKLISFADAVSLIPFPEVKTLEAKKVLLSTTRSLNALKEKIITATKEM